MPPSEPSIVQHFGNAEVANGGFLFQGVVTGDIHIDQRPHEKLRLPQGVPDAAFNAANKQHLPLCLRDTRTEVLNQIRKWADGDGQERVYWLKGMAGTGKSTISLTIAREYYEKSRLAANFFFSRGGGDLALAKEFATTIACQLAEISNELRRSIGEAMEANPRIESLAIYDQWEKLVLQPLSIQENVINTSQSPYLIVIDALDECESEDDISQLLQCLGDLTRLKHVQFQVFITSRPEQPIKLGFGRIESLSRRDFILHDIEKSLVEHDLRLYYQDKLAHIGQRFHINRDLLSDETINYLVHKSQGLFIHAATACRFIQDGEELAGERLALLISKDAPSVNSEEELDRMYTTVLTHSFKLSGKLDSEEMIRRKVLFHRIIGSIVVVYDTLSITQLADILQEPKAEISKTLHQLHSIIDVPERDDGTIQLLHPSFRDYIVNSKRCSHEMYAIDARRAHRELFRCCLRILLTHLRRNPCNIRRPGTQARHISKLDIDKNIPWSVQYASQYWMGHLQRSHMDSRDDANIEEFFQTKYLFWLETLALIGRLSYGVAMMMDLDKLLEGQLIGHPSSMTELRKGFRIAAETKRRLGPIVYDAKRFILSHSSMIEEAPLQVYSSAIIFSPKNSIIRKLYSHEIPTWISKLPVMPKNWSPYIQTLSHSTTVEALAASPNGRLVATASADGVIRIWDAVTGTERHAFDQYFAHSVKDLAFSADGRQFVAICEYKDVSRSALRFWDAMTGFELRSLIREEATIGCIAFSADGRTFAIGTTEGTISILDSTTHAQHRDLHCDAEAVVRIVFSPNGQYLASSSVTHTSFLRMTKRYNSKATIRLWEIATGKELCVLKNSENESMTFSSDSILLAYKTDTSRICLWDIKNASEKTTYKCELTSLTSLSFLHNGELRATAYSVEGRLYIWTPDKGSRALRRQPDYMQDMVSFPDGRLVVTSYEGRSVHIWDAATSTDPVSLDKARSKLQYIKYYALDRFIRMNPMVAKRLPDPFAYRNPTGRMVLAREATILATEYGDKSICLWDTETGMKMSAITDYFNLAEMFSLSANGKQFIYLVDEEVIRIWDTEKGLGRHSQRLKSDTVLSLQLSPDGKLFAVDYENKAVEIWDVKTFKKRLVLRENKLSRRRSKAFSPDGSLLLIWDGYYMNFWNTSTGTCDIRWDGLNDEYVSPVAAFSPNGRKVAFALRDSQTIQLWNVITQELENKFEELDQSIGLLTMLSFSPDGKYFAYNTETKIHLCDAETGVKIVRVPIDTEVSELAFSSCSTCFVTNRGRFRFDAVLTPQKQRSIEVFASNSWIQVNGQDALCIHPDYRDWVGFVVGRTVVFIGGGLDGDLKDDMYLELADEIPTM
ncbi:hypothetical protein TMatcc_003576 [Talaromyces marneffei ATCC 18224]|uniref:Vegetative incompatibility protein HET-E-1 n=1 Tax=Talaromyces marneffei PM1 TaxID=1077442 RepID=A0A093VTN2_TALMA|nr:uncharacterized protein EYB26_001393 [Talaromyces marneffei]KAE8556238.1 hypothetical protein EYB25_000938 [Talaromyces marneffei]QGA13742.1 hypothetical protein EYB26_001393 [Talaromyces marneffei]